MRLVWVGVGFDSGSISVHDLELRTEVVNASRKIFSAGRRPTETRYQTIGTIKSLETEAGELVDVFDVRFGRIGFGIRVASTDEGLNKLVPVRAFLISLGIISPISVWVWEPRDPIMPREYFR